MKIAFQMDPIQTVNIDADSTFRIAEEAQARGHELFFYTPDHLAFQEGKVTARGQYFTVQRVQGQHADLSEMQEVDLADFDVVWLRQDPPFDMHYITTTHLLDLIHPDTLVVNDPFWVRNYPEKLLVLRFPDLTPPTTIARDLETIKAFNKKHGDVILKPLYGNGGAGVFRLEVNKKMYKGAISVILSELLRKDRLKVVSDLEIKEPKTKNITSLMKSLDLKDALLMTDELDENLYLSSRNLYHVGVCDTQSIDPVSLIGYENVVLTKAALKKVEAML